MVKNSIAIALIHNNDKARISYIRPKINALIVGLQKKMKVDYFEISQQPDLKPSSLKIGLLRDLMYWKLGRDWAKYRKVPNRLFLSDLMSIIKSSIKKYIFNRDIAKRWARSCAIEMYVTNKHLRAFANALECKVDYLICFEDDAVFKDDSISKMVKLLNNLASRSETVPTYIDLAGGCRPEKLKIDALEFDRDSNFRYYSKPTTNTACCYLTNYKQLVIFDYFLTRMPVLRYIGIDWCMNKLFMLQFKRGFKTDYRHADPHFFSHGSVTGERQPWAR